MKWMNAACFAENLLVSLELINVMSQCILIGEETKVLRFDSNVPETDFPAVATVASTGCFSDFDVGFEFDCTANTASVILLGCHLFFNLV